LICDEIGSIELGSVSKLQDQEMKDFTRRLCIAARADATHLVDNWSCSVTNKQREMRQRLFDDLAQLFVQQTNRVNRKLARSSKKIRAASKSTNTGPLVRPETFGFAFGGDELDVKSSK
jgi:hypothetical protein